MKTKLLILAAFVSICLVTLISAVLSASPSPPTAPPPMSVAFGPKQYVRANGQPQTIIETFQHCGTGQCRIVVANGSGDKSKRASSASISLNGKQVVGPRDFNQQVATIIKPVTLLDHNQLSITLSSSPGSKLTVTVECVAPAAVLEGRAPGVSLLNPNTLLSAFQIANTGSAAAENVQVTSVTLTGGTLTTPILPKSVGTIAAGALTNFDANFSGGPFQPNSTYALTVQGTYEVGGSTFCFTFNFTLRVPPNAPGSAPVNSTTAGSNFVTGAPFPPQPPEFEGDENGSLWTPPIGPFIPGTPTQNTTNTQPAPLAKTNAGQLRLANAPGAIEFLQNAGLGLSGGNTIAEPSGAQGGGVIFLTTNSFAAYSTNGGGSFTRVNPTSVFPADAIGFCCDQIVQYVPSIDRFIWLLQGNNGFRLASASPAAIISSGGTAWTYWNLPSNLFGQPTGTGVDYPDLSVGNNSLYLSWDVGWPTCPTGCNSGVQVSRISLAGIQAAGTITIEYTNPPDSSMVWGGHLMQNTLDEIFWAGHMSNSRIRVFSLAEGSNTYFWRDVDISSWARVALSSLTPDNQNWLGQCNGGFPGTAVIGSTRVGNQLWFAWSAGTDNNFQQPHVEMITLDRNNNFSRIQQVQIWNNSYAFGYPALATNACTGEVGLSLEYGGNGNFENHVVGFWGDFVVYITTGSNAGTCRFGDYVTIRQAPPTNDNPGNLFTAFGYGVNAVPPPGSGTIPDVRYILFGRPASSCNVIGE
jgi:hypothetical protein